MLITRQILQKLSQTTYVRTAVEDHANLDCFKDKPTKRMVWGLVVIGISYTIGWPAIGLLGFLSVYWGQPLILAVGGPLVYGLSHLTFIVGAWLAGSDHLKALFRWVTRVTFLKFDALGTKK